MSAVRTWLSERTPLPPAPLALHLDALDLRGDGVVEALVEEGLGELARARSAPGRVRESAFHLLAADALITYACEASLEVDDPSAQLLDILRRVAAPGS